MYRFVNSVKRLLIDINNNINKPAVIENILEEFQDENVETLEVHDDQSNKRNERNDN